MPINSEHLASLTDADVIDQHGDKVGGVGQIYLDDASGQPAWASVKSGLFGLRESFVPLATADIVNGNISVPFTKDFIKDAPRVDADNHLDDSQQATLYSYYGLERPTVGDTVGGADDGGVAGGADETATFASEQASDEMHEARTAAEPTAEEPIEGRPEGEPAPVADSDHDGAVTAEYTTPGTADEPTVSGGDGGNDLGSGRTSEDSESAEPRPGDPDWDETAHARFQQENPAANEDWAAEQAPEEPVSTPWSVPPTDPADEEPTRVARSGYAADRPAAHSSAYEGHGAEAAPGGADSGRFGSVEPVTAGGGSDEAVTGAPDQTGTGYPAEQAETSESSGIGAGGADLGDTTAGGALVGVAASDANTTAYEVPGQEIGAPTTDAEPGAEFAADREEPFDGSTEAQETTDGGPSNDPEAFSPTGYRPDHDGSEMTDEERERLNRARGAL